MRITSFTIKNFKSVGADAQQIELSPITLLFGPNSAGKSTVLQALIYFREVILNRNLDPDRTELGGDWLDLGGFRNLIHGRASSDAMELSLAIDLNGDELPDYLTEHERQSLENEGLPLPETWFESVSKATVLIGVRWSEQLERPYVEVFESWINGERIARIESTPDGRQVFLENLSLAHPLLVNGPSLYEDEETVDDRASSFDDLFLQLIDLSQTNRASLSVDSSLSDPRPFKNKTMDEIEDLVSDVAYGDEKMLKLISEELGFRSSRRAYGLLVSVDEVLTETAGVEENLGYIGLESQNDSLPDVTRGIRVDSGLWLEEVTDEAGFDARLLRLLSESLLNGLVAGPLRLLGKWMEAFTYIGPLRELPARNMQPQRTPDRARWAQGLAAWELLPGLDEQKIEEINYWLGTGCLNTGYQIGIKRYRELETDSPLLTYLEREIEMDQQLMLKELIEEAPIKNRFYLVEEATDLEVMPQDIGVGISQLLPVVVLTVCQESGLISIEQPELHVHPAIQVELADLFARYAIKHNKLIILETHSEHLMLRLLRRIREQADSESLDIERSLDKGSVSVQYVESTPEGTKLSRKRIDDDGDFIDEWPNGFFDERDEELFF